MPTIRRSGHVAADVQTVWDVAADPHHRPRWWPNVQRVEEVSSLGWTEVLQGERGRPVRADFTVLVSDAPSRLEWQQELVDTPFERILAGSETELLLSEDGSGTRVELVATRKLRGMALFGGMLVRRATAKQLDEALSGLARAVG
ncbi:MAG: hypothetical protein QOG62_7 [Thermoleophilaceae bacterium]|jgi:carbon monoxide dehydrogenase subunit G|nr:hypothetical protein [Thermoleophilaceae bacterium]